MVPQSTAVICLFSFAPTVSTPLEPRLTIVHDDDGIILIPVWSQFRTNSAGTSANVTMECTSSKKSALNWLNCSPENLLFVVVPFLRTNFILFKRD